MAVSIGINDFGRMGRLTLRAAWDWPNIDIVHINETSGRPHAAAHLLECDSVHGKWAREIKADKRSIVIEGKKISFGANSKPSKIPWGTIGVDIVVEWTGKFLTIDMLNPHFDNGAKKVVVAAP